MIAAARPRRTGGRVRHGYGLSIAFFADDVDIAEVKAAIFKRSQEIGWNDVPRPAPKSETVYRVLRSG